MTDKWMKQYPSVFINRSLKGNIDYAETFSGEGNRLLYQLKNLMTFRDLGQLKMVRCFTDGTVITAKSVFGKDSIEIDVSASVIGEAQPEELRCIITLLDVSHFVQPMRYPGEIHDEEIENKDYLKIYYTVDLINCPDCTEIKFEALVSECIYSLEQCWGEIISQDKDDQGEFIIVKFYTEDTNFSRTGLADMILRAWIEKSDGTTACNAQEEITVDCCEKDSDDRPVEIWWEDFGTCQPYISYPGVVYNAICKAPTSIPMFGTSGLIFYACTAPYQPFYAIPEILGSCLPLEWTLSGPIAFMNSDKNDNLIFLSCSVEPGDCYAEGLITLNDRCGGQYQVVIRPCCTDADPVSMNYTSLLMACSQQQTLSVTGGCGPYSWSLSGGGSLSADNGIEVIYSSPATNPNCTMNPTITVTDCCGSSSQIQLAINCYADGIAFWYNEDTQTGWIWDAGNVECKWQGTGVCDSYDCNGTILTTNHFNINALMVHDANCAVHVFTQAECDSYGTMGPHLRCADGGQFCAHPWGLSDVRTQEMKDAGCCPLNPLTGLPY